MKKYKFFASHHTIKYIISGGARKKDEMFESFQLHRGLLCMSTDLFPMLSAYILKG